MMRIQKIKTRRGERFFKTRRVATMHEKVDNEKFSGELDTTEKGLLCFKGNCCKKVEEKEKDFVQDYNASIKHGDPIDKLTMPDGITIKTRPRRTLIKKEPDKEPKPKHNNKDNRKAKGMTFGISEDDYTMEFNI
jgi:hypothetical protein